MFTKRTERHARPHSLLIFVAICQLVLTLIGGRTVLAATAGDDDLYDQARRALNEDRFREAERMYERVSRESDDKARVAESLYWRAFALYRLGAAQDLVKAQQELDQLHQRFPDADNMPDADRLAKRVERTLAKMGRVREAERDVQRKIEREQRRRQHGSHTTITVDREAEQRAETKMMALQVLLEKDPERAMPILRRIIDDDDPENAEMREHALMILTHAAPDEAEDVLVDVVATGRDPELVAMAIFWLSQTGGERAFDAIEEAFRNHDDSEVQEAVLFAMGQNGGDRAVSFLKQLVTDDSQPRDIRENALFALAQSGADDLVETYMQVFQTETDPDIRASVLFGMAQLDDEVPSSWFVDIINDDTEDIEVRQQALQAATMMKIVDVPFLRRIYDANSDTEMKEQVLYALTQIRDPEALDLLLEVLHEDKDPELRAVAVHMLSQFDDPRVIDEMIKIINEED